jgi:two-component system, OmpR family, response regulator
LDKVRILIVEDDPDIRSYLRKGLSQVGHASDGCESAEEALAALSTTSYDVAVVDLILPGADGLDLISRMRDRGDRTPVLILSARQSVDDRVRGLSAGGDDYLTKPFSFAELVARLQALHRRAGYEVPEDRLHVGDLELDVRRREVSRDGNRIDLQPREFAVLQYLMENAGTVLPKTFILEHVWNFDFDPQTNVLDVLISRLRKKIDDPFETKLIHTVRGVGYVIREPAEDA